MSELRPVSNKSEQNGSTVLAYYISLVNHKKTDKLELNLKPKPTVLNEPYTGRLIFKLRARSFYTYPPWLVGRSVCRKKCRKNVENLIYEVL